MNNKIYYIYHIPNYVWVDGSIGKIGVTSNVKQRMYAYKGYFNEILEEHTDIHTVSRREQLLQKEYGYKVDKKPYWKMLKMSTKKSCSKGGKIGGKRNAESGHMVRMGKIGGKIAGKRNVESGHLARITKLANIASRKPILQYTNNGEFIKEWGSIKDASTKLNLFATSITAVCKGKVKTCGGFVFRYVNELAC